MRRQSKYSPHLMTISETSTIAANAKDSAMVSAGSKTRPASKTKPVAKPPSPVDEPTEPKITDSQRRRVERSQSAPAEVEREDAPSSSPSPPTRSRSATDVRDAATSTGSSASNKYGRSALHNAVRKGDRSAIARLVTQQPGLLREPDARGNLPLHYAANPQVPHHAEVVYQLLRSGSPVNALNARGQSALVVFVISSDADDDLVPRMLLHYHARPGVRVTEEQMLAPYAAGRGLLKVAAAIREHM